MLGLHVKHIYGQSTILEVVILEFVNDCLDVAIVIMKYDPRQRVLRGEKDMME